MVLDAVPLTVLTVDGEKLPLLAEKTHGDIIQRRVPNPVGA